MGIHRSMSQCGTGNIRGISRAALRFAPAATLRRRGATNMGQDKNV